MRFNDKQTVLGQLNIRLFDQAGRLKDERHIHNLVVASGLAWMAARYVGTPPAMSHMAVGAGVAPPAPANTALGAELGRAALTSQTSLLNVSTFSAMFAAGVGSGAITEAGIFTAPAAGTMLNRATFPVVNKGPLDTIQINWTVTQAAG
ncbi:hypothetical protein AAKU55_005257 [Oxalobacteraceae bacterium GrIS 1.11]